MTCSSTPTGCGLDFRNARNAPIVATFAGCLEALGGACASTAWVVLAHSACARTIVAAGTEAVHVTDRSATLYGAAGDSREFPAGRRLRDVRAFTIHWGNNEVLRDTLARASLA